MNIMPMNQCHASSRRRAARRALHAAWTALALLLASSAALAQAVPEPLRPTPEQRVASVKMLEQLRAVQSPLLQRAPGLLIMVVDPAAQAARLGIAPGDVLLKYDGQALTSPEHFLAVVTAKTAAGAGLPVQLVLLRAGASASASANVVVTAQSGRLGIGVSPVVALGDAGAAWQQSAAAGAGGNAALIFPQLGHPSGPTMSVAFSADGRRIASAGADNTIKLWDAASGREMRTLAGHTGMVASVAFSPDGRLLLSGGFDKMIRLWDVATGRPLYSALGDSQVVNGVAFGPDGRRAVSAGSENKVIVWDVATGTAERIIPDPSGHLGFMTSIAFSPDGRHVLTGGQDFVLNKHQLVLWDVVEGKALRILSGHSDPIKSVAFSPDGRQAVSASQDNTLRIWDVAAGTVTQTLRTEGFPFSAAWSRDGRHIASAGVGVTVWDAATGRALRDLKSSGPGRDGPVLGFSVAFGPNGQVVVGSAGELLMWDGASGAPTHSLVSAAHPMSSLALTPDGKQFAVTGWREVVSLWNAADGRLAQSITSGLPPGKGNNGPTASLVRAAAISPDGRFVLAANNDSKLRLSDLATGKELRVFEGHKGSVSAVAFSPDGQLAASAGGYRDTIFKGVASMQYDGTVRVWRVASGETVRVLTGHTASADSVAFSPDGRQVLSAAHDSVRLWDVASGNALRVFEGFGNSDAVFSRDGRTALFTGVKLSLVDLASGAALRTFEGHANQVLTAAFSADGTQALTGSADNTIKLWDVATGKVLRTFSGHIGSVKSVAFSKDGRQVVSAADDATLRVWDLASGRQLVQMVSFKNGEWMAITPEGYFNASSPKATEFLNVTQGQNVYGAGQFYDVFYRPDIVEAALAGRDTRGMVALTMDDAIRNPPPVVADMQAPPTGVAERVRIAYRVQTAGGGIGEVRVFHNGKLVSSDGVARSAPDALLGKKVDQQTPDALVSQMRSLASVSAGAAAAAVATTSAPKGDAVDGSIEIEPVPGDNDVSVIAFNAQNSIQSVVRTVSFKSSRPAVAPRLHILAIGIDEYKDKAVSLKFAAKDARDLGARWQQQAAGIYGAGNITLETLTDAQASRAGIQAKIDEIAARVKPTDHFMLFIASHGVLLGEQYYMVTNDYDGALTPAKLISSAEIVDFSKRIKALSQLYILDTCHAGGMGGVVAGLYDARVSVLARKMGLHVFASASSTEEALDGFEGNGLFTHTLLSGLNNNKRVDSNADQQISLTELGSYSKVQTHDIAVTQKHKQDPLIINFGQDTPVYKLR